RFRKPGKASRGRGRAGPEISRPGAPAWERRVMGPTMMDLDNAPCPDCHRPELCECSYSSMEVRHGYAVVCASCGFSVAGRDREQVLAAMSVLVRWRLM